MSDKRISGAWTGLDACEALLREQEEQEEAEALREEELAKEATERGETPVRRGRPPFVPTEEQRQFVHQASTAGLSLDSICLMVKWPHNGRPISQQTLLTHFRQELSEGTIKANIAVGGKLFALCMAGNPAAIFFWQKTRMRMREAPQAVEVTGKDGQPLQQQSGVILIPVAKSAEEWQQAVADHQQELAKKAQDIIDTGSINA